MSSLTSLVDELANSTVKLHSKDGQFLDTQTVYQYCYEQLSQIEEYEFPILNRNISSLEFSRWSLYWEVQVLPRSLSISLTDSVSGDVLHKCYSTI